MSDWQKIKTAPKDGRSILVHGGGARPVGVARWHVGDDCAGAWYSITGYAYPGRQIDVLWDGTPTDQELASALPAMSLPQRIETIIRKYVGGATSSAFNGENAPREAERQIAKYLLRKMQPWLSTADDARTAFTEGWRRGFQEAIQPDRHPERNREQDAWDEWQRERTT